MQPHQGALRGERKPVQTIHDQSHQGLRNSNKPLLRRRIAILIWPRVNSEAHAHCHFAATSNEPKVESSCTWEYDIISPHLPEITTTMRNLSETFSTGTVHIWACVACEWHDIIKGGPRVQLAVRPKGGGLPWAIPMVSLLCATITTKSKLALGDTIESSFWLDSHKTDT